jgi:hypothetical protein
MARLQLRFHSTTPPPTSSSDSDEPNATASPKTRLKQALRFLRRHPKEKQATACRIYDVKPKTLNNAVLRAPRGPVQHGGQNKGLSIGQERVVDGFIKSYLQHNFLPTRNVVFSVICNIRMRDGKGPLSQDWFTRW